MKSLARLSVHRRWYVLALWVLVILVLNLVARSEGSAFSNTFSLPGTDSSHAFALLAKVTGGQGDADQIVFQARAGTILAERARIEAALTRVAALPQVAAVVASTVPGFKQKAPQIREVGAAGAAARSRTL